ncbi:hypothetical protein DPMN_070458 [Dreissena polymorpha]|uniref:Uncharacterized protein n=1 Tax=Dreissena polymorpha TaxID=45954 RepID=A0A9D4BV46_DREPO|nr:hypothetical protein DPMN_070458 [Dreissena polymorpha]
MEYIPASCENWSYGTCGNRSAAETAHFRSLIMDYAFLYKNTQYCVVYPEYPPQYPYPDKTERMHRLGCDGATLAAYK